MSNLLHGEAVKPEFSDDPAGNSDCNGIPALDREGGERERERRGEARETIPRVCVGGEGASEERAHTR